MEKLKKEYPSLVQKCTGVFNKQSVSIHGISQAVLLSALQKYARRALECKGLRHLLDGDCFALDKNAKKGDIQAVRTNIMNRILIMSVEDCLHPSIFMPLNLFFLQWDNDRDSEKGMASLIGAYYTVVHARKCRMASIVKILVSLSDNKEENEQNKEFRQKWKAIMDPPTGSDFETLIREGDIRCVGLLNKATGQEESYEAEKNARDAEEKREAIRKEKTKGIWKLLWKLMEDSAGKRVIEILKDLYDRMERKKHKEYKLFFYHAIVIATYRKNVASWRDSPSVPRKYHYDNVLSVYRAHLDDTDPITVDSYCIDVHTAEGRRNGMTVREFASEGALVTNEAKIVPEDLMTSFTGMYTESKNLSALPRRKKSASNKALIETLTLNAEGAIRAPRKKLEDNIIKGRVNTKALEKVDVAEPIPLLDRTCGSRPMTYGATISFPDGTSMKVAMKPSNKTPDPVIVDVIKPLFGLNSTGAKFVVAEHTVSCKREANGEAKYSMNKTPGKLNVYLVTKLIRGSLQGGRAKMVSECKKDLFKDPELTLELLRIGLVRSGLLRSTDFNPRNVVIDEENGELYSIDENSIGTCGSIFPYWSHMKGSEYKLREALENIMLTCGQQGFEEKLRAVISDTKLLTKEDIDGVVEHFMANVTTLEARLAAEMEKRE